MQEEEEAEVPNPWADKARMQLEHSFDRPRSRMSVSALEDESAGYSEFLVEKGAEGDSAGAPAAVRPPRSARRWDPKDSPDDQQLLHDFQREIGLAQPQPSFDTLRSFSPGPGPPHQLAGQPQSENSLSAEGEDSLMEESQDDLPYDDDESLEGKMAGAGSDPEEVRSRVLRMRTLGGVASMYKGKEELQTTLERRAAISFIQKRRGDADATLRALQTAEEQVHEVQGHLDEIDERRTEHESESARLSSEDPFANRDRIRVLSGKVEALRTKRAEEEAALAREVEREDVARRAYNTALIELRRVEEAEGAPRPSPRCPRGPWTTQC